MPEGISLPQDIRSRSEVFQQLSELLLNATHEAQTRNDPPFPSDLSFTNEDERHHLTEQKNAKDNYATMQGKLYAFMELFKDEVRTEMPQIIPYLDQSEVLLRRLTSKNFQTAEQVTPTEDIFQDTKLFSFEKLGNHTDWWSAVNHIVSTTVSQYTVAVSFANLQKKRQGRI